MTMTVKRRLAVWAMALALVGVGIALDSPPSSLGPSCADPKMLYSTR